MNILKQTTYLLGLIVLLNTACEKDEAKNQPNESAATLADFDWIGTQQVNSPIQFVNKSQNADTYKWDFGNGETATKGNPDKVTYASAGVYSVTLVASKNGNKTLSQKVLVISADNQPVAHFSYEFKNKKSYAPATIHFINSSVNAQTFKWNINGNESLLKDPNDVTFNQAGTYQVVLTAINGNKQATYRDVITVEASTDPVASFVLPYHPYPYHVNEPIQFINTSKNSDAWLWTFGTGGPANSTDQNPEVKFTAAGMYTITLVAKKGAVQSTPRSINLQIMP